MARHRKVTLIELGGALYLSSSDAEMFLEGLSGDVNVHDVEFAGRFYSRGADAMFSMGKLSPSREKLLEEISVLTIQASRADASGDAHLYSKLIDEILCKTDMLNLVD